MTIAARAASGEGVVVQGEVGRRRSISRNGSSSGSSRVGAVCGSGGSSGRSEIRSGVVVVVAGSVRAQRLGTDRFFRFFALPGTPQPQRR